MSDKNLLKQMLDEISVDTIWDRASHVCDTWPDRLPGTPGAKAYAEYVAAYYNEIGLDDVKIHTGMGLLKNPGPCDVRLRFGGKEENDMLALAACLEEHYPHSMAKAVVAEAENRHISHEERHSSVSYIVAHGIASSVDGEKVVIGSAHFVFEDESCTIPEGEKERFDALDPAYSHLYLAVGGELAAVICISDPLREEACAGMRSRSCRSRWRSSTRS